MKSGLFRIPIQLKSFCWIESFWKGFLPMGNHLVFVGGGHAHLTALVQLREYLKAGHKVTLISPSPYHYYSGMGPGMLSGIYRPQEVRFHVTKLAQDRGAGFISDVVMAVDPYKHILPLKSGKDIIYDVVSFNTGSEVAAGEYLMTPFENIFPVKPIINLLRARRLIRTASRGRQKPSWSLGEVLRG
jgi:NADH dehydrogenase FAD-containing subunit